MYGQTYDWKEYQDQLVQFMRQYTEIQELSKPGYFESLLNGKCHGGALEVYAASILT
jgi:hypothetical protein